MEYAIVLMIIVLSIGLSLAFVGALFALLTALGNKQYVFGVLILLVLPLSLVYCALNWDKASYSGKMLYGGSALVIVGLLPAIFLTMGT